jgi:LPS O-antigen subunit length determinant protein (WzzB/FepE family)
MQKNDNKVYVREDVDEVELIDLINVLCDWKKTIILGTIAFMLLAGVVSYILPPVFRVATIIEIGLVEDKNNLRRLIEEPIALVEKVKGKIYDETIRTQLSIPEEDYPAIKVKNPKGTALVEATIDTPKKEEALNILKILDDLILEEHAEIIRLEKFDIQNRIEDKANEINLVNQTKLSITEKLKLINKSKEQLMKQSDEVSVRIAELEKEKSRMDRQANPDNTLSLLLFTNQIQENRRYYYELQDRLNIGLEKEERDLLDQLTQQDKNLKTLLLQKERLETQLEAFRETRIAKKPTQGEKPVKPKKKLNVIIAGVTGFTILVFTAFFMTYLQEARKRKIAEEASEYEASRHDSNEEVDL